MWKLESGTTIGRVEQLAGSQTIFGALSTNFHLRIFDSSALTILMFWAVSVIGSQAALRIVSEVPSHPRHMEQVTTLDPQTPMWHASTASDWATDIVQALFSNALISAMSSAVIEKTQDSYGNLKLPMLETLDGYSSSDWVPLPTSTDANASVTYSSLVGLPFGPQSSSETSSFTLHTSYLSLDCPVFRIDSGQCEDLYKENLTLADEFLRTGEPLQPSTNNWTFVAGPQWKTSDATDDTNDACEAGFLLGVTTCYKGCTPTQPSWNARKIAWSSTSKAGFSHVECDIRTTYADVNYTCEKGVCQAQSVRQTPDPPHDANVTAFDMTLGTMASGMIYQLARMYPAADTGATTPVMEYILSPSEALTQHVRNDSVSIIDVGRRQFEIRLGQLINTIYLIGISPSVVSGQIPIDQANVHPPLDSYSDYQFLNTSSVESTVTTSHILLQCHKAWFSVLVVASSVSLAAGIAGIVIRSRSLLPDVLGTLALANMEAVPTGGSTLDGLEKARLLKHYGVKMVDVEPAETYGRIALVPSQAGNKFGSLDKQRLYI